MLREEEENQGSKAHTRCCGKVEYNADALRVETYEIRGKRESAKEVRGATSARVASVECEAGAIERREPEWCVLGACRRARGSSRVASVRDHRLVCLRSLRAVGWWSAACVETGVRRR